MTVQSSPGTEGSRVLLVSGDSHVGPHLSDQLRPYCPENHLAEFDERSNSPAVQTLRREFQSFGASFLKTRGHDDPDARIADMDRDGVAAEIIFHGSFNGEMMPFQDRGWPDPDNPELAALGFQIYNRWLAAFCASAPERLIGLAHLPMWDLEGSIKELQWAADHGFRGVNFPVTRPGWKHYNDPYWEPFWTAAEDADMVLTTHASGLLDPAVIEARNSPLFVLEAAGGMNRRPIPRMIFGGVFERHPNLKLAMTEQPGLWIPYMLTEMDSAALAHASQHSLPKRPSEYFMTNVFVGASFMAPFEARAAIEDGSWTNLFWGRDYPHPEGTWKYTDHPEEEPLTHLSLRHAYAGLPEDQVRAMVGGNAIRIYGLDTAKLQAVAEKVGPTIDEITTPLATIPELNGPVREGMGRFAFRTLGPWA
jgi:predicted TIM-barrel fold metal-dependent hydrolase